MWEHSTSAGTTGLFVFVSHTQAPFLLRFVSAGYYMSRVQKGVLKKKNKTPLRLNSNCF